MDFIIFAISMAALIYGADKVVKQSEIIALHFGISKFVIGASLVAVGTSLPEMAASISASLQGSSELAVSNVVGSNIFNISLILGLVFLVARSITPQRDLFAKDSAWTIFPLLIFLMMALDGNLSRFEGFLLLLLMVAYIYFLATDSKELLEELEEEDEKEAFDWMRTGGFLLLGFAFVIVGADFAVGSASSIAQSFGVSEWIVGILLVAIGTSLPELTVSIVAARNNNADMSIGNIIGSNVANVSIVLGSASLISPIAIDLSKYSFDIFALISATVMLVFITANKLYNKSAGIALLIVTAVMIQNTLASM